MSGNILVAACHTLYDAVAVTDTPGVYLSPEIDLGTDVRVVSFHLVLGSPSSPVGNITVEGANDVFAADGATLAFKDLGLTPVTLANVDAESDDAYVFSADCTTRKIRVRVTCSSGSCTLTMKAHGKTV